MSLTHGTAALATSSARHEGWAVDEGFDQ